MPDLTIKSEKIGAYVVEIIATNNHYKAALYENQGSYYTTRNENHYPTKEKATAAFYRYKKWARENQ